MAISIGAFRQSLYLHIPAILEVRDQNSSWQCNGMDRCAINKVGSSIKATPSKFFVSHFIDLKNTCGLVVHYPLFLFNLFFYR